jgi:hypothetical protein
MKLDERNQKNIKIPPYAKKMKNTKMIIAGYSPNRN